MIPAKIKWIAVPDKITTAVKIVNINDKIVSLFGVINEQSATPDSTKLATGVANTRDHHSSRGLKVFF